jgi:hypothetical protein
MQGDWVSNFGMGITGFYVDPPISLSFAAPSLESPNAYAGTMWSSRDTAQMQITAATPVAAPDSVVMQWIPPTSPGITVKWRGVFVAPDSVKGTREPIGGRGAPAPFSMICITLP